MLLIRARALSPAVVSRTRVADGPSYHIRHGLLPLASGGWDELVEAGGGYEALDALVRQRLGISLEDVSGCIRDAEGAGGTT